jgi:transposase InsO family protein
MHPHVRVEDEVVGERHQEVLASGTHRLDRASGERAVRVHARQRRIDRLEPLHPLACQGAVQRARRAEDGVAFGQPSAAPEFDDLTIGRSGHLICRLGDLTS